MSAHAIDEIRARHISGDDVRAVLAAPEQTLTVHPGRIVLQSLQPVGPAGRSYVLRVFVDIDRDPPVVVTVYRSSKISKYWSQS